MNKQQEQIMEGLTLAAEYIQNHNIRGNHKPYKFINHMTVLELLEEFRHNALCRNESNQNAAKSILNNFLMKYLNQEDYKELNIELFHYNNNEMTTEEFGLIIKNITSKYE